MADKYSLEDPYSANFSSLTVHNVTLDDAGEYKCNVSNVHGEQQASAVLQVQCKYPNDFNIRTHTIHTYTLSLFLCPLSTTKCNHFISICFWFCWRNHFFLLSCKGFPYAQYNMVCQWHFYWSGQYIYCWLSYQQYFNTKHFDLK